MSEQTISDQNAMLTNLLEAAQAEIATANSEAVQWKNDWQVEADKSDAALARLAVTEEANSMLLGRNKWLEHVLAVQTSQAPTCDLRGIDAGPLSEWVDLVRRGYVAKDECLIAVKDVPKWLAQNQPSQADAQDAARYRWLREYLPSDDLQYDDNLVLAKTGEDIDAAIDAAINAKGNAS